MEHQSTCKHSYVLYKAVLTSAAAGSSNITQSYILLFSQVFSCLLFQTCALGQSCIVVCGSSGKNICLSVRNSGCDSQAGSNRCCKKWVGRGEIHMEKDSPGTQNAINREECHMAENRRFPSVAWIRTFQNIAARLQ